MEIIRGRLSAADFSNPSQRYNPDTDTVQYSPDGGTTWIDSPEADPRHSDIFRLPPLTTSDPKCDAAANQVKWIKDFIDSVIAQLDAGATALAVTNNFLTQLTAVFPPALLLLLLQEAATSLFDTGSTALSAAFTSTQYDLLLCAFYCFLEPDGTCTAADLVNIETKIAASMDATAAAIVDEILFIQGEVGLSNAGVIGGQTGDCNDCACFWCHGWDFQADAGSDFWTPDSGFGTWVLGSGWISEAGGLILRTTFAPTTIREIAFSGNNFGGGGNFIGFNLSGVRQLTVSCSGGLPYSCPFDVNVLCDEIILNPNCTGVGNCYLFTCTIQGEGTSPFGADNC